MRPGDPTRPARAPSEAERPVDSLAATEVAGGEVGSLGSLLREVAATGAGPALAPGTVVGGQYRIERAVGAGGMGVVYRATDERLGRAVALKLGTARSAGALARLEREAAALARLSHPNVVVVYQVGEHAGRVYLAMEYVDGGTLRTWAAAAPRRWREVVAIYAAAGDGLAAAHAAGLVHRDFKPDNVLVGADGRPRVADFGLVRAIASADVPAGADEDGAGGDATRAGTIMGTPAYMPPEQRAGEEVDARADQYAFCASLWEALFGERPPAGQRSEPRGRVPRHLVEALRRGLRPARDERWPSLAPLLAVLRRDPAARRRTLAVALGGPLVVAAVAVPLALRGARAPDPCTDGPAALAPTWSPARAARLARALGADAWPAVERRLEAYTRAWTLGHREACQATRVARSQPEALLAQRMACLHRARLGLDATLDVIERGGAALGARAPAAVDGLPGLDACADTAELAALEPLPSAPALRAQVEAAASLVAQAHAATYEDARPGVGVLAERAITAARAGGWKPQIAEALGTRANLLFDGGKVDASVPVYQEAVELALAGGSDRVAAKVLADQAWAQATLERHAEAARTYGLARALWERQGRRVADARKILNTAAYLAQQAGRHEDAIAAMRELLRVIEAGGAIGSPAPDHYNLASALIQAGHVEEGLVPLARALELAERSDGPGHANVARYLGLRAQAEWALGRTDAAIASARRAIAIYEAWFGPDDHRLPYVLAILADARAAQGQLGDAVELYQRARAIVQRVGDATSEANAEQRIARLEERRGALGLAAEAAARAVAIVERVDGHEAPGLAAPLRLVAHLARLRGERSAAIAAARRALAVAEASADPDELSAARDELARATAAR